MDFKPGESVEVRGFGSGTIVAVGAVEQSSDGDSKVYAVRFENGDTRHFKEAELA